MLEAFPETAAFVLHRGPLRKLPCRTDRSLTRKSTLAGATPETLALASLGRPPQSGAGAGGEAVVSDEPPPVAKGAPHEPGDDVSHLVEGV